MYCLERSAGSHERTPRCVQEAPNPKLVGTRDNVAMHPEAFFDKGKFKKRICAIANLSERWREARIVMQSRSCDCRMHISQGSAPVQNSAKQRAQIYVRRCLRQQSRFAQFKFCVCVFPGRVQDTRQFSAESAKISRPALETVVA